jgi:hypothetical protein
VTRPPLHHGALLYSGNEEYITAIRDFTRGGVEGGGAVLIAVPEPKLAMLRASLGDLGGRVQFADTGVIEDPLVGRRMPPADRSGGRGVWLMNQLSDLVELRSGPPTGTVVRIHMRRASV